MTATNTKLNFVRKNEEGVVQYYVPPSEGKLLSDNWMDITLSGNETSEFDTEKSVELLNRAIGWITAIDKNSIVLDFFAGSATAAHSVMQLNAEDGGNRKFIMVQLPEDCDEKSEAFKAGYKTIAEISKERIRRTGKKIKKELLAKQNNGSQGQLLEEKPQGHTADSLDIGFRVLKIDSSNMADVYYSPDAIKQGELEFQAKNIKEGRNSEDLLFQVLLDWGVDLSLSIRKETIQGKAVYLVNEAPHDLVACFDDGVNETLVKELAGLSPLRVVFRDTGFASDAAKINVAQIFKQMSPGTDVKAI